MAFDESIDFWFYKLELYIYEKNDILSKMEGFYVWNILYNNFMKY